MTTQNNSDTDMSRLVNSVNELIFRSHTKTGSSSYLDALREFWGNELCGSDMVDITTHLPKIKELINTILELYKDERVPMNLRLSMANIKLLAKKYPDTLGELAELEFDFSLSKQISNFFNSKRNLLHDTE